MRVLVFEQWQGGHYFNYLECLVPRLAQAADEVVVAITDSAYRSKLFAEQLGALQALPNVRFDAHVPLPRRAAPVAYRLTLGRHLVDAIKRNSPDYVFLPSADEQSIPLPLLAWTLGARRAPVEGVFHYKAYTAERSARERFTSAAERVLLKTGAFAQLNFANFLQCEEAMRRNLDLTRFARVAGDPVPQPPLLDRREARAALGLKEGGRLLAMIGALDDRKAVLQTLAAFRAARVAPDDRLLLAGKLYPHYADVLRRDYGDLIRTGRLIVFDRFLSDIELRRCYAAADVNCSVYIAFYGLSSLMLKSIAADVPVITGNQGWGSAIVNRFQVGHCVNPHDLQAYAALLPNALDRSVSYVRTSAVERLLRFHSVDNFADGLLERYRLHAGIAEARSALDWPWVMQGVDPERRSLR